MSARFVQRHVSPNFLSFTRSASSSTYFSRPIPTLSREDVLGLVVSRGHRNSRGTRGVGGNPLTPKESAALGVARRNGVLFLSAEARSQQLCNSFFKYCWCVKRPYVAVDRHGVTVVVDLRPLRGLANLTKLNRWKTGLLRLRGKVAEAKEGGGATADSALGAAPSPSSSALSSQVRSLARRLGVSRLTTHQVRKRLATKRLAVSVWERRGLARARRVIARAKRDFPGLNAVTARTLARQRAALLPGPREGLHSYLFRNTRLRLSRRFTLYTPSRSSARSVSLSLVGALGVPSQRVTDGRAMQLKAVREEKRRALLYRRLDALSQDPEAMKNLRVPAGALDGFLRYRNNYKALGATTSTDAEELR